MAWRSILGPLHSTHDTISRIRPSLGQTKDQTIERGDIIVTDDKAKALSRPEPQPRTPPPPAAPRKGTGTMPALAPADAADPGVATTEADPAKRAVRAVGPTFISPNPNPPR